MREKKPTSIWESFFRAPHFFCVATIKSVKSNSERFSPLCSDLYIHKKLIFLLANCKDFIDRHYEDLLNLLKVINCHFWWRCASGTLAVLATLSLTARHFARYKAFTMM